MQADIGLIGLGVMGGHLALNIAEKGFTVAVYTLGWDLTQTFVSEAGQLAPRLIPCETLENLVSALRPPQAVILLVPAGAAVDDICNQLSAVPSFKGIIIDGGNSDYTDTERRQQALASRGLSFLGMGVSGGAEGARNGPSIMVGGKRESYQAVEKILLSIAAKYQNDPCCAWLGPGGAGHFVKTIHNGIEYADMQMIAEIYAILRDGLGMAAPEIAKVFGKWNAGPLDSYLIEITARVLDVTDMKTRGPLVDVIVDRAGQKGTGKWSVIESQKLGVPATTLEAAVAARILSSMKDERSVAEKTYAIPRHHMKPASAAALIRQLEAALLAGKISAYAQGFAVLEKASQEKTWDMPLATIASIWRAGCIIRSQFLGLIASSFAARGNEGNLLLAPDFVTEMKASHGALRKTVAQAAEAGIPVPALAAALGYFDGYRQSRGSANLIQAQRDFFGAHGFERSDEPGAHHGPWLD